MGNSREEFHSKSFFHLSRTKNGHNAAVPHENSTSRFITEKCRGTKEMRGLHSHHELGTMQIAKSRNGQESSPARVWVDDFFFFTSHSLLMMTNAALNC